MEPYALYLLRRFDAGESLEELVRTEGIQRERILIRLRAALQYAKSNCRRPATADLPFQAAA